MNEIETAQLLTIAAGFDRFIEATPITTGSWRVALAEVPFAVARDAVVEHYKNQRRSVTVADILDAVAARNRTAQYQIDADVRSAKARGLVSKDWPAHLQLEPSVAVELAAARKRAQDEAGNSLEVEA